MALLFPVLLAGCSRSDRPPPADDPFTRIDTVRFEVVDRFPALGERFNGLLGNPFRVMRDETGNTYVVDAAEGQVVVFGPDRRPIRVIGRRGQGPGEFRFSGVGRNVAVGAVRSGYLALLDLESSVVVFRVDGTYVGRLPLPFRTLADDVDVRPDGTIVVATHSEEGPIKEYRLDGSLVREYGEPILKTGLDPYADRSTYFRLYEANRLELAVLSDGRVVTLGNTWTRLSVYRDGVAEVTAIVDLRPLLGLLPHEIPEKEQRSIAADLVRQYEYPPAEVERQLAAGRREGIELPSSMLFGLEADGDVLWLFLGDLLLRLDDQGTIRQVVRVERLTGSPPSFGVGGGWFALPDHLNAGLAWGRVPASPH